MPISPPSTAKEQIKLAMLLKDAILETYNPEVIILFGSLGRGDTDEFSDVDLLVVMETEQDVNELSNEISDFLDPLSTYKHIIVRTPRDFFNHQDIPGTIVFSALQGGRILFQKTNKWIFTPPIETYDERKREVLNQEYMQAALEYLSQAESQHRQGHFFSSRDLMRFATIRAVKGIFVKHDIHPPRETDLMALIVQAENLEPKLEQYKDQIYELNNYIPDSNNEAGDFKSGKILQKTTEFVINIITTYGIGPEMRTSLYFKSETLKMFDER